MVILTIGMTARPGKRKELFQTLLSIIDLVRVESGCLHAALYLDIENENEFMVVEKWTTKRLSDDHQKSNIFTVLRGTESLLLRPPEIMVHSVDSSRELEA